MKLYEFLDAVLEIAVWLLVGAAVGFALLFFLAPIIAMALYG
jgi:hypothetical protein